MRSHVSKCCLTVIDNVLQFASRYFTFSTKLSGNAKTDHLPRVRRGTNADEKKYDSVRQYLHTYFTLLREECFFKLKKGILGFLNGDLDPKDMALYRCVPFV